MIVDYEFQNWCGTCRMKYPKSITKCLLCHKSLRQSPVGNKEYRKRRADKHKKAMLELRA